MSLWNMGAHQAATDIDSLFRQYHRDLAAFAYRRLRDREAASDLVQDTFVRYITHARDADSAPEAPRFFLWRIASNLILDLGRRQRRRGRAVALEDAAPFELADPVPSPERYVVARDECRVLRRALDTLPANVRAALLMNRVEQLTHAEIAARLGVSSSMVNKYIMRALRHCAGCIADTGP